MLNPMPAALEPRIIATRSMIKTPPQKPVCAQFIVRNVPGLRASRRNKTMASMSMRRQAAMKSMKTTTLLRGISIEAIQTQPVG
jgi:hypothetical protein